VNAPSHLSQVDSRSGDRYPMNDASHGLQSLSSFRVGLINFDQY
jgi:hypothetical protein